MLVMSCLGLGQLFGTVLIGQVYDRLGHRAACVQNMALFTGAGAMMWGFVGGKEEFNGYGYVMAMAWGAMDSSVQTHTYS